MIKLDKITVNLKENEIVDLPLSVLPEQFQPLPFRVFSPEDVSPE